MVISLLDREELQRLVKCLLRFQLSTWVP